MIARCRSEHWDLGNAGIKNILLGNFRGRRKEILPHIILTHSPVHGPPEAQTGFLEPYHCPTASFSEELTALAARHANIKCILGGHNHLNMRLDDEGTEFVTVSSLVETPFECKLFEVTPRRMKMTTLSLISALTFDSAYDAARSFVQGRDIDRSFCRSLMRY